MQDSNKKIKNDVFEEVVEIFAASGVEITPTMLERMAPLLSGSQRFEEHRALIKEEELS